MSNTDVASTPSATATYVKRVPPPDKVKMRIGVLGTARYSDYEDFDKHMSAYVAENDLGKYTAAELEFNGGGTEGTDMMLERWCSKHAHTLRAHRPDFNAYIREASFQRNRQLAARVQKLVIFFDRDNSDERDLRSGLEIARKQQKPVKLLYVSCQKK